MSSQTLLRTVAPHVELHRDRTTGLAWAVNGRQGCIHSCHADVSASGPVQDMEAHGYWRQSDRTVRLRGFIHNLDSFVVNDEYDQLAARYCRCQGCINKQKALGQDLKAISL